MSEQTILDKAHAAMEARPDDGEARLSFYSLLADSEIHVLLEAEAGEESIEPRLFTHEGVNYVLGFDSAARLTQFAGGGAPYAAISGRILAQMLSSEGAGLAFNPEVAPSAIMLPPEAMMWMTQTLTSAPPEPQAPSDGLGALVMPDVPDVLLHALDAKLGRAAGLANAAYLCGRESGGMMLAIIGARESAQPALAKAASEALVFSGLEDMVMDVAFFNESEGLRARFGRVGLRFDIPQPAKREIITPGSDPDKPPKLR